MRILIVSTKKDALSRAFDPNWRGATPLQPRTDVSRRPQGVL
jgi:hypothetical protein